MKTRKTEMNKIAYHLLQKISFTHGKYPMVNSQTLFPVSPVALKMTKSEPISVAIGFSTLTKVLQVPCWSKASVTLNNSLFVYGSTNGNFQELAPKLWLFSYVNQSSVSESITDLNELAFLQSNQSYTSFTQTMKPLEISVVKTISEVFSGIVTSSETTQN